MACVARDDINSYSVKDAMAVPKISKAIGENVRFFFAGQAHPKVEKSIIEMRDNRTTNAFWKSDKSSCQWVFASVMKDFRNKAIKVGGNAVIDIRSNYKDSITSSKDTFQCGSGAFIAGVGLIGKIVKIKDEPTSHKK